MFRFVPFLRLLVVLVIRDPLCIDTNKGNPVNDA